MLEEGDPCWLQSAKDLITLLQEQVGQSQAAWDRALESYVGERVDYVVVRGLAKILTDAATFTPLATPLPPIQLRERLFHYGPVFTSPQLFHPQTRYEVLKSVADELSISSEQVETTLFADRPATYLLNDAGPQWTPAGLIAPVNPELALRGVPLASHIHIETTIDY